VQHCVVADLGKGCADACAAGLGCAKQDRSQEMGPRKHNRTPYPPCTHACFRSRTSNATKVQLLVLADVKGGPCTLMCRRVEPCKTRPVSGNGAQKTQTNEELPIHRAQLPAEGPGHQMRPRCSIWSWQM